MHDTKRRKRSRASGEQDGREKVSHRSSNDRVKTKLLCFWKHDVPAILKQHKKPPSHMDRKDSSAELESFLLEAARDLCRRFPDMSKNAKTCAALWESKIEEAMKQA